MSHSTESTEFLRKVCAAGNPRNVISSKFGHLKNSNIMLALGKELRKKINNVRLMKLRHMPSIYEEELTENQNNEVLAKIRLESDYYRALRPCVERPADLKVAFEYYKKTYLQNHTIGLPIFAQITIEGTLSLIGYRMSAPICEAFGDFL